MPRTALPPLRVPSWPWWAALAACVAGVVLLYAALVWSSAGQVLEYQVFRAVEERYADTVPDLASRVVRLLPLTLAAGVALASLGALAVPRWRRRGRLLPHRQAGRGRRERCPAPRREAARRV